MLHFNQKQYISNYELLLKMFGSLSKLFSESSTPYLHYRIMENVYCKSFVAENVSRADVSVDAVKDGVGIGLKTFTVSKKNVSTEKIAEFDTAAHSLKGLNSSELVLKLAELRNRRLELAKDIYNLEQLMYHCLGRRDNLFLAFEEPMDLVDTRRLKILQVSETSIAFSDQKNSYRFSFPKSTLYKTFKPRNYYEIPIAILDDPYDALMDCFQKLRADLQPSLFFDSVVLPLYSEKGDVNVPEKSGLNAWNAGGRTRKSREVYVPIPSWIHKTFPNFFPPRDTSFQLVLPNKSPITVSVCQAGGKALMSNPNTDLGDWLLDVVLKVPRNNLVTYEMLQDLGIDSVEVFKHHEGEYSIDFRPFGSYSAFKEQKKG